MPSSETGFGASYGSGEAGWTELTAQQLVRYEALFSLLDDLQLVNDISDLARRVAPRWKYFANVTSWRLVAAKGEGFAVIDGRRGEATVADVTVLDPWDEHYWTLQRPHLIPLAETTDGPAPPAHLATRGVVEIEVLPITRHRQGMALLSVAARHASFTEMDAKFIRIFGGHLADRVSAILLREEVTDALVAMATHDSLTGALTRGAAIDRLESQIALASRMQRPIGVLLADVDHFKALNDTYGHLAGDDVLREVSRRLERGIRQSDVLGRYGGEEFLFVLFPCDAAEVANAAERFRRAIADAPFTPRDSPGPVDVTISFGAVSAAPSAATDVEWLLKQADDALYRSKARGRNRVTVAEGDRLTLSSPDVVDAR